MGRPKTGWTMKLFSSLLKLKFKILEIFIFLCYFILLHFGGNIVILNTIILSPIGYIHQETTEKNSVVNNPKKYKYQI